MRSLRRGTVAWADFSPTRGREQAGRRLALVVASDDYLAAVPGLVIALPVSTRDRGWPHHVRLTGPHLELDQPSWALTEQPRTISRDRLTGLAGAVSHECLDEVDQWLRDFIGL
jgi:mRNA interferase MazF